MGCGKINVIIRELVRIKNASIGGKCIEEVRMQGTRNYRRWNTKRR